MIKLLLVEDEKRMAQALSFFSEPYASSILPVICRWRKKIVNF